MSRSRTGSIERHRSRFRVRWTFDGERHRRSFDSEQEAREFLERLRANEVGRPHQRLSDSP
jgi:hypothetical protein